MKRYGILFLLLIFFFTTTGFKGTRHTKYIQNKNTDLQQDTLKADQYLYIGREWMNLFYMVEGDQFLFSNKFLTGSVTIQGRSYRDISIKYDVFKDEILIPNKNGGVLQLNKEMVDSFKILFQNRSYLFTKIMEEPISGYVNVLYKGRCAVYVKYIKKIKKLAVEGTFDEFYLVSRIYFEEDNVFYPISGKRDLLNVIKDEKDLIRSFIKKNRLKISKGKPESLIPVARYFDSLKE